jgi:hypothetical protein
MSDIIDINVYETTEDVTINVTEEVIEVNINQVSSGSIGAWGSIIGDIADQTDLQNALDLKVDKVAGKELSENDFTDILKTKLDGIQDGAEVNVNADWNSVSGDSEILNKPTIPSIAGLATVTYVDNQDALKEDDLGNPLVDGYVLASTVAGVRSWVEQSGGGGGAVDSVNGQVGVVVLDADDIDDSTTVNKFVTDADLTILSNTSGINTGDQDLSGLVPYTGATSDVNLGEFGLQTGNIEFDLTPTSAPTTVGSMVWNDNAGTLDLKLKGGNVTLQIGQETVARVVNKTATNITLLEANYQVVRITGAQGGRPKVDLALANNDANSTTTLGIVTETILNNQEGFITTSGQVQGINTTGTLQGETWADGDIVYLSGTVAGRLTNIKPVAPIHTVIMGIVEYAHITQGKIFVKVDNGYELSELHDVSAIAPNNNEVLTYDTATLLWKPKTVSTALGYTPENQANKENTTLDNSSTKYPTNNLVKTNIDLKVDKVTGKSLILDTEITRLAAITGTNTGDETTLSIQTKRPLKTIEGQSLEGVGNIDLTKSDVGLSNVDNTSDLLKPISTATQTALNLKQDTLTNPITGTGTTNRIPKFTGTSALGDSQITDNGTNVGIKNPSPSQDLTLGVLASGIKRFHIPGTYNFDGSYLSNYDANGGGKLELISHNSLTLASGWRVGSHSDVSSQALTFSFSNSVASYGSLTYGTPALSITTANAATFASTLQATRLGLGAAANLASYLNVIANTSTVGQIYFPPSAVDYTGTLSGMLWNNTSEWKFYDGVLSSVNRLLKLNGNTALANANALNVVTSTGTGGNLGTLKAEVAFSRFATAVSYTILLTDVGFGWVIAVTSTAAARTITLPLANAVPAGWQITVKDESGGALTNNITISRSGSDLIDGATSNAINLNYGSRTLYSDGVSKWFLI